MSSLPYNNLPEPDDLQLNMETISKELNDLVVAGEKDFANVPQLQQTNITNPLYPSHAQGPLMQVNNVKMPQYMMHYCQQTEKFITATEALQNVTPNLNHMPNFVTPTVGAAIPVGSYNLNNMIPCGYIYTPSPNYALISKNINYSPPYATPCAPSGSPPNYEFHYLRPQTDNVNAGVTSLHSSVAKQDFGNRSNMGAYRKYQKPFNKHRNPKILNERLDYDKIVVDLSILGWSKDGKEINPVLRLFALIRDLNNAIAEMPPSFEPIYETEYESTFAPLPKCNMPCTMNVQYQIKQACRKINLFFGEMQHLLDINKMYDRDLHAETEVYLTKLRSLISQFEMYKRIELEHKRGKFSNEDNRVHAERLEILLEHINRQIREVRVRIIAFDWFIGIKYRGQAQKTTPQIKATDESVIKRSEIGVINEILQLCNIKINTASTTNSTPTEQEEAAAVTLKSDILKTTTELNNTGMQAIMHKKSQIIKNNVILAAVSNGQNSAIPATNCSQKVSTVNFNTTRQPVFYIG